MDDFLYNVRTGNIKNMDRSNRRYDNNRYKSQNRQPVKDRRKGYVNYRSLSSDQFSALKELMASILDNQTRQTTAMEKIADALSSLANMPSTSVTDATPSPPPVEAPAEETADSAVTAVEPELPKKSLGRAEMVALVHELRERGLSYEKISDEFEVRQISTLSGRGRWRGQTIYRLFKEK